jgi:hypothetical protein
MRVGVSEIERLAGRIIISGFDGLTPPTELLRSARKGCLGGVIIFKRNVENTKQV